MVTTLQCLLRHCGFDPQSVFGDGVRVCCVGGAGQRPLVSDRWLVSVRRVKLSLCLVNGDDLTMPPASLWV